MYIIYIIILYMLYVHLDLDTYPVSCIIPRPIYSSIRVSRVTATVTATVTDHHHLLFVQYVSLVLQLVYHANDHKNE
jgi:hypothetical protein